MPPLAEAGARHAEVTRERYLEMVDAREGAHHRRRRVPDRAVTAPPAPDRCARPLAIYRALRAVNPSPYMFFLETDGLAVVGASPETHVSLTADGTAALRPIAGTRPRGDGAAADDALAAELAADEKERAEHMMLVDLARNDLARVCAPGTVRPRRLLEVERYSHVMHLVSDVQGRLRESEDAFSLLRDTFPAGTVSGAPKVRAMQIISRAGAAPPRHLRRRGRLHRLRRRDGHVHRAAHDRDPRRRRAAAGRRRRRGRLGARARARGVHQQDGRAAARRRPGRDGGVRTMTARVLLIDNYDSFTYNLAHGLAEQGAHVDVFRHDELTADEAVALQPTHLVISPGPGRPSETGISADLIERLHGSAPILGVCLGHQLLAEMHGGTVTHAQRLVHGKAGMVEVVADDPLLAGLGDSSRPAATTRWPPSSRCPTSSC